MRVHMHKKCDAKVRLLHEISKQFRQKLLRAMNFSLFAWPFAKKSVSLRRYYAVLDYVHNNIRYRIIMR
jgi:hypothetical protein